MADTPGEGLPRIPELVEDFELVEELGRGGTSVVYLARDRDLGRNVAIKLIRPSYVQDEDALARLVREARTVGKLQHPNIVMLLGTRRLRDHGLALILQYVPGITLKQRIQSEGPLPFAEVERTLRDLGGALAYAHRQRIVHRDIKPENIYLDEGCALARLADFGLARAWDSDSGLTLPGTAIGTPTYMSPEQVDGADLDGRSDLYSLGLVGYEMLTGRQPWAGESLYSVIYKQKHEELPPIAEHRPDTPANLRRAIEGAIHKDPDDRWVDARAFLEELERGSVSSDERGASGEGAGGRATGPPAVGVAPDEDWESPLDAVEKAVAESAAARTGRAEQPDQPAESSEAAGHAEVGAEAPSAAMPGPPESGGGFGLGAGAASRRQRKKKRRRTVWLGTAAVLLLLAGAAVVTGFGGGVDSVLGASRGVWSAVSGALASEGPTNGSAAAANEAGALDGGAAPPGGSPTDPPGASTGLDEYTLPEPSDAPIGADDAEGEGASEIGPAGAPARAEILGGNRQEGSSGETLPLPLVVRVVDAQGRPVPDVPVVFDVQTGGGAAQPARRSTGEDGTVTTRWTLGPSGGDQLLLARAEDVSEAQAAFEAGVAADPAEETPTPASLRAGSGGGQQGVAGQPLEEPLEVQVLDEGGSPVGGVAVQFEVETGGGSVEPNTATTGGDGTATARWVLGNAAGEQTAVARVPGVAGARASFTAIAGSPGLAVRAGVAVGGTHSCSLRSDGTLLCWGANDRGQLGIGSSTPRPSPARVEQPAGFTRLASGLAHACALDAEGRAYCWGANDGGQLGTDGGGTSTPVQVRGEQTFGMLSAGVAHTCGLSRAGAAYCWGANESGQLGDGSRQSRGMPTAVGGGMQFQTIAAGWRHTCALDSEGRAYCWGEGESGQLGAPGSALTPRAVGGDLRFSGIAAGNAHTCGLARSGRIYCWGANDAGQLGDGTTEGSVSPRPVEGSLTFSGVSAGGVHTCGVADDGAAFCWGANLYGQLGDGTTENRAAPVPVAGSSSFVQLDALGSHNCGRTAGGEVLCWGFNVEGQLGNGTRENRSVPIPVSQGN